MTSCEDRLALDIGADGLIPIVVMDVKLWGLLFLLLLLLGGLFINVWPNGERWQDCENFSH